MQGICTLSSRPVLDTRVHCQGGIQKWLECLESLVFVILWLAYFTQSDILQDHPCCDVCVNFCFQWWPSAWIVPHSLINIWEAFSFFAIVNNSAAGMGRQRLLQELTLTLWGYSETKLLKHIIIRFKILLEMNMLLSIEPLLFHILFGVLLCILGTYIFLWYMWLASLNLSHNSFFWRLKFC